MTASFPVRVLSISDQMVGRLTSPVEREALPSVDLILACGDLPYYYVEAVMGKYRAPTFFVRGNHDQNIEYGENVRRRSPFGAIDLHKRVVNHNNLLLAGLEGSLRYRTGPFMYTQAEMWLHALELAPRLMWNKLVYGRYLDVLVTHAPPWGIHDQPDWVHQGFKAFRWLLKIFRPSYHFHGHIHLYDQDQEAETIYQSTKVINTYSVRETVIYPGKRHYPLGDVSRARPGGLATALDDFRDARRRAAVEAVISGLQRKSKVLMPFEQVRKQIAEEGFESRGLQRIALDTIAGSVGRYQDFTRKFFPRRDSDEARWVGVRKKFGSIESMPPIEVYQIGEVYFVLDGNHRVSVARQNGETHIRANVIEIETKVPFSPEDDLDDLIIKAEQVKFLEDTQLGILRPEVDFSMTAPGRYRQLRDHVSAHHYWMELSRHYPVKFENAVTGWVDEVYMPVVRLINQQGLLRDFPGRTPADLYLWLVNRQKELAESLGWSVEADKAAEDLRKQFGNRPVRVVRRWKDRLRGNFRLEGFDPGPPPGEWRRVQSAPRQEDRLFSASLVAISGEPAGWRALDQALAIAKREGGVVRGAHISMEEAGIENDHIQRVRKQFDEACQTHGVAGEFAIEQGNVAAGLSRLGRWNDLVVVGLSHPPADQPIARLRSGLRTLIQTSPRPVMAVPAQSPLRRGLLGYDGSLKATEALYLASYLAKNWKIDLVVTAAMDSTRATLDPLRKAEEYLRYRQAEAEFVYKVGHPGAVILKEAEERGCDFIIMGGYGLSPVLEVVLGSTVDQVLAETKIPVIICR